MIYWPYFDEMAKHISKKRTMDNLLSFRKGFRGNEKIHKAIRNNCL